MNTYKISITRYSIITTANNVIGTERYVTLATQNCKLTRQHDEMKGYNGFLKILHESEHHIMLTESI